MTLRADQVPLVQRLTTLSDLVRLRMLRVLERHEVSVGELARALQLPQSTVSRHLKVLHEGGWIRKRTEGTASLYQLDPESLAPDAASLWDIARQQLGAGPALQDDDRRLAAVITARETDSRSYFGRLRGEWDEVRQQLFGSHFTAEALVALAPPNAVIADLGCGTGYAVELLAPHVATVIAVDQEPGMLEAAQTRLAHHKNVEFRCGDLLDLPLDDASIDVALILLVLHHIEDPAAAIRDTARTLVTGGRILVVDMVRHDREGYQQTMAHRHLGFAESDVVAWTEGVDLHCVSYRHLHPDTNAMGPGLFAAVLQRGEVSRAP